MTDRKPGTEELFTCVDQMNDLWKKVWRWAKTICPAPIKWDKLHLERHGDAIRLFYEDKSIEEQTWIKKVEAVDDLEAFKERLLAANTEETRRASEALDKLALFVAREIG